MVLSGIGPTQWLAALSVLAAAIAGVLGVLFWRRRDERGALWLGIEMAVTTLWLAGFALQLSSPTLETATVWFRLQSIGLVWIPVTWLAFVAEYTDWESPLSRRTLAVVSVVPFVDSLAIATNGSFHSLSWTNPAFVSNGPLTLLSVEYGPLWWAVVVYSYAVIAVGFTLLVRHRQQAVHIYRRQTDLILLASLPPGVTNVVYYLDLLPYPALDPTPFAFTLTGLLIFWTLFRYRLFELSPVARRSVVEDMDDAMFVFDDAGRIIDLNGTARSLVDAADPVGAAVADALPPLASWLEEFGHPARPATDGGDATRQRASAGAGYATQEVSGDTDNLVLDRGDDQRVYDVRVSILRDRNGTLTGFTTVLHDVTARERREETLTALHEASRDMMRPETVEGVCECAIEAAREIIGLEYAAVHLSRGDRLEPVALTANIEDLYDQPPGYEHGEGLQGTAFERGETLVVTEQAVDDGLFSDEEPLVESAVVVPLGEYGVLGAAATTAVDLDDERIHFAEVLAASAATAIARADREETVRKRERELEQQNERLEEFASVVSHDLRNPLNVASGHLEHIEADGEHADAMSRSLERMEAIIDDVLTLARQGEPVRDPQPVDLGGTARSAWSLADTRDATLQVTGDATVLADRGRLQQLCENLFRNAVEHGGPDVTVTVEPITVDGQHGDGTVVGFAVADDGSGIPADERDGIFESGYSTETAGTGLGLSIVRQVVEDHGWTVAVSESDAGGARFEVTDVTATPESTQRTES